MNPNPVRKEFAAVYGNELLNYLIITQNGDRYTRKVEGDLLTPGEYWHSIPEIINMSPPWWLVILKDERRLRSKLILDRA